MKPICRILSPIDFSPQSLRALDSAIELARQLGATVVVMHVCELPAIDLDGAFVGGSDAVERIEATAERALYSAVAARLSTGVPLEPMLRCGTPWREIDVAADDVGADLIVLPAHERHGVLQALLGGHVAERVIATAHKSVLTVRDAEATAG